MRSYSLVRRSIGLYAMVTLCLLIITSCSKPETQQAGNSRAATANQTERLSSNDPKSAGDESSSTGASNFHITGVLLNKNRSPAVGKTLVLEEITGQGGDRKASLRFEVVDNEMKLANPHAKTDAKGQFDIEVSRSLAEDKKQFGLALLEGGNLYVGGKSVSFKMTDEPREIRLGEVIIK